MLCIFQKMKKIIIRTILLVIIVVFINGCYYVFHGQFSSAEKIRQGRELSLYEICSIYTMHQGICIVGWFFSPEATKEVIGMSFRRNRGRVIEKESDFFLNYRPVSSVYATQFERKRIAVNGDVAYAFSYPGRSVALAVNPGYLWRDENRVYMEAEAHYPKCYDTHIGLPGGLRITINECLFSYLEDKGILHPYTIIYSCPLPSHNQ